VPTALAVLMWLNKHNFSGYMVRLIFSSKKHREANITFWE